MRAFSETILATSPPPVMEARRWIAGVSFPPGRPLLNLSQAAPVDPPPAPLHKAMAEAIAEDDTHLYGPVLGRPELRAEIAARWSGIYGAEIGAADVAITSGCNQAFCAAIAAIAAPGDAVMLPTPWYFNHKMWLDTAGIETVPLPCGADMVPRPEEAERRLTGRTRAIVLVTPNNPTGAEYPAEILEGFSDLARSRGLSLVVDETYRDFHSATGAPHRLFETEGWRDWLVHLYSFSKVFRLTGHRIGALVTGPDLLAQTEKFLDSVAICPNQLGQKAALYGLRELNQWVAGERAEILRRRAAMKSGFNDLPGWELLGCGAYFAYVRHPFDMPSDTLARRLVAEQSLLVLPGTMFAPMAADGGGGVAETTLRIAFANADTRGIAELFRRLRAFVP